MAISYHRTIHEDRTVFLRDILERSQTVLRAAEYAFYIGSGKDNPREERA